MSDPFNCFLACHTVDRSPNQWNLMIIVLGLWLSLLFTPSRWHLTIFISAIFSSFMMFLNTSWTFFEQSSFSVSFILSISMLSFLDWDSIFTTLSSSLTSLDCSCALTYFCWLSSPLSSVISVLFWLETSKDSLHVCMQSSTERLISSHVLSHLATEMFRVSNLMFSCIS